MRHGELPSGLTLQRTTPVFDSDDVPAGLRRAHRIAPEVWGAIEVLEGTLVFAWEEGVEPPVVLTAGDSLVIPPDVAHHVEPGPDARFHVRFHR